jgi:hypothetical protein
MHTQAHPPDVVVDTYLAVERYATPLVVDCATEATA